MSTQLFSHRYRVALGSAVDDDPLSGVANLFDVSLAFIVALIIALFSLFSVQGLLDPDSDMTIMSRDKDGNTTLVSKSGKQIKVEKVTDRKLSGSGTRLGVAYQLPDGQVVYVPEAGATP